MWLRFDKELAAILLHNTAERIQSAHERPIRMHGATLLAQEHASAVGRVRERAPAVCREARNQLRCCHATIPGEARDLVRIDGDLLVVATPLARVARIR